IEESRNRGIEESRNRGIEESRNRGIERDVVPKGGVPPSRRFFVSSCLRFNQKISHSPVLTLFHPPSLHVTPAPPCAGAAARSTAPAPETLATSVSACLPQHGYGNDLQNGAA